MKLSMCNVDISLISYAVHHHHHHYIVLLKFRKYNPAFNEYITQKCSCGTEVIWGQLLLLLRSSFVTFLSRKNSKEIQLANTYNEMISHDLLTYWLMLARFPVD